MGRRKYFDKDFFSRENHEPFYVLGFFAADGSLVQNKRGGCYFSIQSKDRQILQDIKKSMKSAHKISKRLDKRTGSSFFRIQIGSKHLYEHLLGLGFEGDKTKNLPTFPMSQKYFRHFLRGYFDGDGNVWSGTIHKKRKKTLSHVMTAFTSASRDFLKYLQSELSRFLKTTGSLVEGKTNYYRLQYSKYDSLKIYDFMYNSKTPYLYLKRKKRDFDRAIRNLRP